jgi:alpha-tubulin suppressor-like RCC1 family protein
MNYRILTSIGLSLLPPSLYMITTNSQTFSWGSGTFGQLGVGDESSRPLPQLLQNVNFDQVVARGQLSAGVTGEG